MTAPRPVSTDRLREDPLTPWLAQRLAASAEADTLLVIAARQTGKTSLAAALVLRAALARPGTASCVLAPTRQFLRRAIDKLAALAEGLPGIEWKEQKSRFELRNGSTIECVSAESAGGEASRGLTIHAVLWVDEAALVPEHAVRAARGCLLTGKGRVIVTSTPVGRNWLWREWNRDDAHVARVRFRAAECPFTNQERLLRERKELSPEVAAQELDAEFVDDLALVFPDTSRLFVTALPDRSKEPIASLRYVLGIDLGQKQDWLVATLLNRWGEAVIVERVQGLDWTDARRLIADLALHFQALVVLDDGPGGGAGAVLESELRREHGLKTLLVHTAVPARKAEIVAATQLAVRWEKLKVLANEHAEQLRHELRLFQSVRRIVQGKAQVSYQGPQLRGEHDDCVISLCLAQWGRLQQEDAESGQDEPDPEGELRFLIEANKRIVRQALEEQMFPLGGGLLALPEWARQLPRSLRPDGFFFYPDR